MSYIFVSHASEDKVNRIKPIVEILIEEAEPVWIDRPGSGENCFQFEEAYIAKNAIDYLDSGESWSSSIQSAIRHSGVVLGCLSNSLLVRRDVIIGELTIGQALGKLATCIVDDLDFMNLHDLSEGLLDISRAQAPRIDPALLRKAIDEKAKQNCSVEQLPSKLYNEWEKVRNLIGSINRVRTSPRSMRQADIERIAPILESIPIGPRLNVAHVPEVLLYILADHVYSPQHIRELLTQASQLVFAATKDADLAPRLAIRHAALPMVGAISADAFWTQAFAHAGLLSRRTVAALLSAPVSEWALQKGDMIQKAKEFIDDLRNKRIP